MVTEIRDRIRYVSEYDKKMNVIEFLCESNASERNRKKKVQYYEINKGY